MKALGILAGPRHGRATDRLLDAMLEGLRERGVETEKADLYALRIEPCRGCYRCLQARRCFIADDHPALLEKMGRADIVIFATPTYWSNVSSEAKKFFDRGISFFEDTALGPRRKQPTPSRVVLLTVCGAPFPFSHLLGVIPGALRALRAFFRCTRARLHPYYVAGLMDAETSNVSEKQLARARRFAARLA